jgi:ribonuclease inhibitor
VSEPARRAVLDARHDTRDKVFDALAHDLAFPPHWGRNLDALYDVLRRDIAGPLEIVWRAPARNPELDAIRTVLRDVAHERSDVTLKEE